MIDIRYLMLLISPLNNQIVSFIKDLFVLEKAKKLLRNN